MHPATTLPSFSTNFKKPTDTASSSYRLASLFISLYLRYKDRGIFLHYQIIFIKKVNIIWWFGKCLVILHYQTETITIYMNKALSASESIGVLFGKMNFSDFGRWMYSDKVQPVAYLHRKIRNNRPISREEINKALDYIEMLKKEIGICENRLREIEHEPINYKRGHKYTKLCKTI